MPDTNGGIIIGLMAKYPDAKAALGGDATKMVDLCLTLGCDHALCVREVALPHDKAKPLPLSL